MEKFQNKRVSTKAIVVENLPEEISKNDLEPLFSQFGSVTAIVIPKLIKRRSGVRTKLAYVLFSTQASAEKAAAFLDGKICFQQKVKVELSYTDVNAMVDSDSSDDDLDMKIADNPITRQFFKGLQHLTISRKLISSQMVFALLNYNNANSIAVLLVQSLTKPSTPKQRKLARLYLLSDILMNCSSQNTSCGVIYKDIFIQSLTNIVKSFSQIQHPGRLSKSVFIKRVSSTFDSWVSKGLISQKKREQLMELLG